MKIAMTTVSVMAAAMVTSLGFGQCSSESAAADQRPVLRLASHEPTMDIVDTAVKAGSFKTLAAALQAAGLVDTLKGKGPFTVLAPTDAAFAKLPKGTVENLLKPENKEMLAGILKFHVIPGAIYADKVVTMSESAKTLEGQTFYIKVKDGKVMVGNEAAMAGVTATDIEASNGVIHVIDTVLMPK